MSQPAAARVDSFERDPIATVDGLIFPTRGRAAMDAFKDSSQARVDEAVTAIAWSLYKPEHAEALARMAVEDTGIGNAPRQGDQEPAQDLRHTSRLMRVKSVGVIGELPELGLVKYAKPVGVVGAVTPSTNPAATPVNKAMMALKGRNAIVIAPSPAGLATTTRTVELMRAELEKIGAPADLVQVLPPPVDKPLTNALMAACDLVVVTGSQNNVRNAYRSGTPAIGVGAGNVPGHHRFEREPRRGGGEDSQVEVLRQCYFVLLGELGNHRRRRVRRSRRRAGAGRWIPRRQRRKGRHPRHAVGERKAQPQGHREGRAGVRGRVRPRRQGARLEFFMVEEAGVGRDYPFSDEKLALVLTVYRARSFDDAVDLVRAIMEFKGKGHSVGIHTEEIAHARRLAEELDTARVLVNMAHTFGNGGGFDSGLNFTLSMGCGTWQGNSISENLNYRHFLNITHLAVPIPEDRPAEEALFGAYWEKHGK